MPFSDPTKWNQLWFADLPAEHKLLWIYINDHADQAGVLNDFSSRQAAFNVGLPSGTKLDLTEIFKGIVVLMKNNRLRIMGFVEANHKGGVNLRNLAQGDLIKSIQANGLTDITIRDEPYSQREVRARARERERKRGDPNADHRGDHSGGLVRQGKVRNGKDLAGVVTVMVNGEAVQLSDTDTDTSPPPKPKSKANLPI